MMELNGPPWSVMDHEKIEGYNQIVPKLFNNGITNGII